MLENVLVGFRGECVGEDSLTGNEGAGRGREKGDILMPVCCDDTTICECDLEVRSGRSSFKKRVAG